MKLYKQIPLFLFLCLFSLNLFAQNSQDGSEGFFTIYSNVLDEDRNIRIHLPEGYGSVDKKYPVFYRLDGIRGRRITDNLKTIDELSRDGSIPEMIVVAIGNTNRNRDMLPIKVSFRPSGGADNFLEFISSELIPYIESNYRTAPYKAIYGESNSALFAIYALLLSPEIFNACIANSPTIGWCRDLMYEKTEDFFTARYLKGRRLYMIYGEDDHHRVVSFVPDFVEMIDQKAPEDFKYLCKIVKNTGHVPETGLNDGLLWNFRGFKIQ